MLSEMWMVFLIPHHTTAEACEFLVIARQIKTSILAGFIGEGRSTD
jgi:hypothetical protein